MDKGSKATPPPRNPEGVFLDSENVRVMRHRMHELANVFTGVMIAAGLLSQYLEGGSLESYAADICSGSERGSRLVREIRSQLLVASGEAEPAGSPAERSGSQDSGNKIMQSRRQE